MQIYRGLDIGTAKPTKKEQNLVKHHMLDVADYSDDYTVFDYQKGALEAINDILSRGKTPIICGGTGLYIDSILFDLDFSKTPNKEERAKLMSIAEVDGGKALYEMLLALDPNTDIHPNNTKRIIRAIERLQEEHTLKDYKKDPKARTKIGKFPVQFEIEVLNPERAKLYDNINSRVDEMLSRGLIEEVQALLNGDGPEWIKVSGDGPERADAGDGPARIKVSGDGPAPPSNAYTNSFAHSNAAQAIGYKEVISYLKGETTRDAMVDLIKKNTRHYAKRQITWMKKYEEIKS